MLKVFFVDDEPFITQGLSMIIDWAQYGYEISGTASNGKEAIEMIKENVPDLIIADIRMPQMTGFEMVEQLKSENVNIGNVVMLSGYSDFEYARRAIQDGCFDYLLKPIDKTELISVLERIQEESEADTSRNRESKPDRIAPLVKFFQSFNVQDNMAEVEQIDVEVSSDISSKEVIDELIYAVRTNRREDIESKAREVSYRLRNHDNSSVRMEINYILFEMLHLAYSVDASSDKEEVLQFISDSVLDSSFSADAENGLAKIMLDFAEYLVELRGGQNGGVLGEIEADIKANYAQNLTLKGLGNKYFINPAYLGQIFKKKYNESFKDYLNRVRIENAESLLINTDKKVYEVAEMVGYKDLDYFIDKFIALKGCTPARFRKNIGQ